MRSRTLPASDENALMRAWLQTLRAMMLNDRAFFVVVNVGVNLLFLLRSYVTMRVLDYAELGLVTMLQSIILLIGAMQFGFLNGGYRLLCSADDEGARRINDLIYSFVGLLALASLAVAAVALAFASGSHYRLVTLLGVSAGVLTLVRNWMSNQMIARVMLRKLNRISLWSAMASIALLAGVGVDPFLACLGSIVLQPAVFAASVFLSEPSLRPRGLAMPRDLVRQVLVSGFVMFLTGIFLQVNTQLERWYVLRFVGLDALGHLYLAILFIGLFQLVPSSLDAIFLTKLVRAHANRATAEVSRDVRRFFLATLGYSVLSVIIVATCARPLLELLLPKYIDDLRYVYLVIPGLVIFTLASPLAIMFNVLIRYRYFFYAYGLGSAVTAAAFVLSVLEGRVLGLTEVTLLKSSVYGLMAAILLLGYLRVSASHTEFRFNPWSQGGGRA
jgi:O-antigen/teichoic acid export membrane protein